MAKKRMAKTAPWKDRIRELRRVPASSLVRHPKNPRQHPESQKAAMQAMLKRVGYADALLVREDADGALHLIDGEMRSEIAADAEVPVLVLDVTGEIVQQYPRYEMKSPQTDAYELCFDAK